MRKGDLQESCGDSNWLPRELNAAPCQNDEAVGFIPHVADKSLESLSPMDYDHQFNDCTVTKEAKQEDADQDL